MVKPEKSMPVSYLNIFMSAQPFTAPPNHAPTTRDQYRILPSPSSPQYLRPSRGIMTLPFPPAGGQYSPPSFARTGFVETMRFIDKFRRYQ
ncbi:hypothetical protein CJ030_MR6G013873 [Morella rubra]|uniref:Uncharacterized protein n=1 Tax=Morella rubra TaxID=262757 RepID=A0A6A1VCH6_9ROSI|nr:hypothetical protein CJ030_MR0G013890 [Morella rubra]KAB1210381.1 hypothetical protein CJ030_MR6G013873 [Morella rubra]